MYSYSVHVRMSLLKTVPFFCGQAVGVLEAVDEEVVVRVVPEGVSSVVVEDS